MPVKKFTNRLINEKSPYLLQHAHNPVDWYPWGEEAFARAKDLDKPIFLSIGYSTCHWCHVMERESFEDEEVAEILNREFVPIKVDKEERPDVDAVYMTVCQAMTGQGGWPLTILMTPDQKPFFSATYIPKEPRYGMLGLIPLLNTVARKWAVERTALTEAGEDIRGLLQQQEQSELLREGTVSDELVRRAVSYLSRRFDSRNGGFGTSPKFPTPHTLYFLLRVFQAEKKEALLQMVEKTLQQMARGGIFDHIGGGFCRYSTDNRWLVPHFEKMLYDNALLSIAYVEAFQVTGNPFYFRVAQRTLDYVLRDLTDEKGGFFSAQDADSEGEEGLYYLLDKQEILELLGPEHGETFCRHLDLTQEGNFEGRNIPNRLQDDRYNEPLPTLWLEKVDDYRKSRTELKTDDKILTSWNGLMIAGMTKAYEVLDDERYLTAARRAMTFVWENMTEKDCPVVWYRDGQTGGHGNIDDYAFTVWALLELYDATGEPLWLERAVRMSKQQVQEFYDEKNGGFYLYGIRSERLLIRPKEVYDGAIPSGNSVTAVNFLRLATLTEESCFGEWADHQLKFIAGQIEDMPASYSFSMQAILMALVPGQTVICVLPDDSMRHRICQSIRTSFLPNLTLLTKTPQNASELEKVASFTKEYTMKENQPTFYICENHACSAPIVGMEEWENWLASHK